MADGRDGLEKHKHLIEVSGVRNVAAYVRINYNFYFAVKVLL